MSFLVIPYALDQTDTETDTQQFGKKYGFNRIIKAQKQLAYYFSQKFDQRIFFKGNTATEEEQN